MHDLTIRNARVLDGTGSPAQHHDVGVTAGRITEVAAVAARGRREVDGSGLVLMPGIIDLHTHFDAQVTWDATLSPSPSLGVTTVVTGNCGFGIAPARPGRREALLRNLAVVEGMDLTALQTGVRWNFETFGEYLDAVRAARPLANVAVFAQHSTIRDAVMGDSAVHRAEATPDEIETMRNLVREALQAGAIGFASSWSPNHAGAGGAPMPSTIASERELEALTAVLGETGRGVFMMATGPRGTPDFMESIAARIRRPVFMSTVLTMHNPAFPERGRSYYDRCAEALARGNELYIQCSCQPLSFDFTLRDPYLLYSHAAFAGVKAAEPGGLPTIYASPAFRAAFRHDLAHPRPGILFHGHWEVVEVARAADPSHARFEGRSIADIAAEAARDPLDVFLDLGTPDGLDTRLVAKLFNSSDDGVEPLVTHPAGVITLSDAGAHLKFMCDAGFGLHLLGHWVRERGAMPLAEGVRRLTSEPAARYRIPERGRIVPGCWADLVLFDPDRIGISSIVRVSDLPGGAERAIRKPRGIHGVWVNGQPVHDGQNYVDPAAGPGHVLDRFAP